MKSLQKFYHHSYVILLLLTILMAAGTVATVVTGDINMLTGWLATFVFIVFAALQIVCLALYQPAWSVYKVGFYALHVGLLILLAGLAAFSLVGESITVQVPINPDGRYFGYVQNEKGEEIDLGFAFKLDKFTLEKYKSGSDKYYKVDMTFADPTTLAAETDYLEVNRTVRKNGWKIYLMSYSDGISTLSSVKNGSNIYSMVHKTYSASGKEAGVNIINAVYEDIEGKWYDYYLYDEANSCFVPVSESKINAISGSLWACTFPEDDYVAIYLTQKDGSFAQKLSGTGSQLLAKIEEAYPNQTVSYYKYISDPYRSDYRSVKHLHTQNPIDGTEEETPSTAPAQTTEATTENPIAEITDSVHAYIRVEENGAVDVYITEEEITPAATHTSTEGGSSLLATLMETYGVAASQPTFQIYDTATGWYTTVVREEIIQQAGVLNAYAVNMGDSLVIFVHPLSTLLLLKRDPGEFATLIGMILVMVGGVMMCLFRKRKQIAEAPATEAISAPEAPQSVEEPPKAAPANSSKKKHKSTKGGKKR